MQRQLRPLFDRVVIKESAPTPTGCGGRAWWCRPVTHEPPPQHGIVLAVGPGVDWWESAGVAMPVKAGRPRRVPGRGRGVDRGRRGAPARVPGGRVLGVIEQAADWEPSYP